MVAGQVVRSDQRPVRHIPDPRVGSRWERGAVTPGAYYLRCLSMVLDVPLAILEGQADRREFLTDAAGAAIAPLVASDLLSAGSPPA